MVIYPFRSDMENQPPFAELVDLDFGVLREIGRNQEVVEYYGLGFDSQQQDEEFFNHVESVAALNNKDFVESELGIDPNSFALTGSSLLWMQEIRLLRRVPIWNPNDIDVAHWGPSDPREHTLKCVLVSEGNHANYDMAFKPNIHETVGHQDMSFLGMYQIPGQPVVYADTYVPNHIINQFGTQSFARYRESGMQEHATRRRQKYEQRGYTILHFRNTL